MTIAFQKVLFVTLAATGAAYGIGLLGAGGALLAFGTYFGWFAATISLASYLLLIVLLTIRGKMPAWGSLGLVNAGLSLLGIAVLGLVPNEGIWIVIAVALGAALSFPAGKRSFFETRLSVVAILVGLVIAVATPLKDKWALIMLSFGVVLIGSQIVTYGRRVRPLH